MECDNHRGGMPNFEIMGSNSYAGWAHLIKLLLKKRLGKPSSKTIPVGTRSKTSFLTSTTAVDTQRMSKIQSRLVAKPKIIQSLSPCKNYSINLLDSSNHLWDAPDFRVPYDIKGLTHFRAYPPNNY